MNEDLEKVRSTPWRYGGGDSGSGNCECKGPLHEHCVIRTRRPVWLQPSELWQERMWERWEVQMVTEAVVKEWGFSADWQGKQTSDTIRLTFQ